MITNLKLHNIGLFKDQEFKFEKINIISGSNFDEPEISGNGCGKSSILNSILFAKYGDVPKKTIQDLLRNDSKSGYVELTEEEIGNSYVTKREIPTNLSFSVNSVLNEGNTNTLKQEVMNKIFGDKDYFLKFRLIDNKKGINILDLGITSLRNTMMEMINDKFSIIRKRLLDELNNREKYSKTKRLYQFNLSEHRLKLLESEAKNFLDKLTLAQKNIDSQQIIINKIKTNISSGENKLEFINNELKQNQANINVKKVLIQDYNNKIEDISKESIVVQTKLIDYSSEIKDYENEIIKNESELKETNEEKEISNDRLQSLKLTSNTIKSELKQIEFDITKLENEIKGLESVEIGTKCDKCGSLVTEEHRGKETKDRKVRILELAVLRDGKKEDLNQINLEINNEEDYLKNTINFDIDRIQETTSNLRSHIKELNRKAAKQAEEFNIISTIKAKKQSEIEKYQDLILRTNKEIGELEIKNDNQTIELLIKNLEVEKTNLNNEEELGTNYHSDFINLESKRRRTNDYLMKLKEAFKFQEYKYNVRDLFICSEAIKLLDNFASYYINKWLSSLQIIINNLLLKININVEFTPDKEFLKIKNGDLDLKFNQLSDGQQIFLNSVFKLAILLNNGETQGIILIDEGVSSLDQVNLNKLINICQELNFQIFLIYQNINKNIENVNFIDIERRNGESKVK